MKTQDRITQLLTDQKKLAVDIDSYNKTPADIQNDLLNDEVDKLIENFDPAGMLRINTKNVFRSGAIDREQLINPEYCRIIAKQIFYITLSNAVQQYGPRNKPESVEYDNLKNFI